MPRYVVGLMFASDATMLASFGDAKLWPLYMFFANDSKYRRSKTSLQLGEEVAYFEKVRQLVGQNLAKLTGVPHLSFPTTSRIGCLRFQGRPIWPGLCIHIVSARFCTRS
jgi:hypothetical protein